MTEMHQLEDDELQIKVLRTLSGEQRLKMAFELYELALEAARACLRSQYPHLDEMQISQKVKDRLSR